MKQGEVHCVVNCVMEGRILRVEGDITMAAIKPLK